MCYKEWEKCNFGYQLRGTKIIKKEDDENVNPSDNTKVDKKKEDVSNENMKVQSNDFLEKTIKAQMDILRKDMESMIKEQVGNQQKNQGVDLQTVLQIMEFQKSRN